MHGLFQGIVQKLDQLQRQLGRDLTRPEMLRGAQTGESCQACYEQPLTANFGPAHRELQVGQSLICGMLNQCLKARGGSQAHATLCPGTREQWAVLAAEMKEQASVLERIASGSISMDPMFSNDWRSNPNPFYRALIAIAKELDTLRTPAREAIENSKIHANAEICRDTANRLLNSMFRSFAKYDAVYLLVHAQDIFAYLSNKGALEKLFATLPKEKEETSAFDRKLDAFVQQEHAYIQEATDLILSKGDKEALEILGLTSEKSITKAEVVLREDVEGRANNLQQVRAALMHLARHTTDMRTLINRLYGYADNGGKAYCETLDKWWYGYQAVPAKIAELIKSESEAVGQYKNLQTLQSQLLEDVRSFINDGHANQSISFSDEKASEAGVSELKRKINIATKDLEHRLKFVTGKCTEISRFQAEIESRYSDAFSSAEYKEAFAKVCDLLHRMAVTEQLPLDKFRILQENGTLEEVEAGGKMSSKTIRARLDAL
ncbi:MAG: hypothetical protein KDK78_05540, partial [Chlamydiia bacterium]|nr:hypothetical protein [Chlamydiia bacterium]